jgi:hypothetical protein
MKTCSKCGNGKPLDQFSRHKKSKDGRNQACKACCREANAIWYENNKDRQRAYCAEWRALNRESDLQRKVDYNAANSEKIKARNAAYYQKTAEDQKAKRRELYRQKTAEIKAENAEWASRNRGVKNAISARRHAQKLQATPKWSDAEACQAIYREAAQRTKETGVQWDVDHVVPLQGRTVCGLHVPWNLQIITKSENCSKHNKHS